MAPSGPIARDRTTEYPVSINRHVTPSYVAMPALLPNKDAVRVLDHAPVLISGSHLGRAIGPDEGQPLLGMSTRGGTGRDRCRWRGRRSG